MKHLLVDFFILALSSDQIILIWKQNYFTMICLALGCEINAKYFKYLVVWTSYNKISIRDKEDKPYIR